MGSLDPIVSSAVEECRYSMESRDYNREGGHKAAEDTPRKILKEFPTASPALIPPKRSDFQGSATPGRQSAGNPTPRKILRGYPQEATPIPTNASEVDSQLSPDPTPRKLIKGLMNSHGTPLRYEDPAKELIKSFPAAQTVSLSDSRDMSLEDAHFSAQAHRDLIKKGSFQDYSPKIVDGTFTLGPLKATTAKDLIRGFQTAENGVVEDSREWSSEDAEFNKESLMELVKKESFQDCFPQIIDGTFTLGLATHTLHVSIENASEFSSNTDEFVLELPIEDSPEKVVYGEEFDEHKSQQSTKLIDHSNHSNTNIRSGIYDDVNASRHTEESFGLTGFSFDRNSIPPPPLPLPSHSPISKRSSPSPSSNRQKKSLIVMTHTSDQTSNRSPIASPSTPYGSHPATPITASHPQSPSISVAIPWTSSNDRLHLSSTEKNNVHLDQSLNETISETSTSSSEGDSGSETDSSDDGTDLSRSGVSSTTMTECVHAVAQTPFLPPPPPVIDLSTPPTTLPPPPVSLSSSQPIPPLPQSAPISLYKRSSSYINHMAFLDFVDITLHLLNIVLWLLILLSIIACLMLVYIRHLLLTSEEESIMMFGIEISPAIIAL